MQAGYKVVPLCVQTPGWDLDVAQFEGFDAIFHLAGEPIASRWTCSKKKKIWRSRVDTTSRLSDLLSKVECPPRLFVSVSAIGFYGDGKEAQLTEEDPPGQGFLPFVCQAWEKAAEPLTARGVRVVHPRFGSVVGPGGIVAKLTPLFRLGLGGALGSGKQWMSWIALHDLLAAMHYVLRESSLTGPVNFTSPYSVRQKEFAQALAHELHRPALIKTPGILLQLVYGQMANEMLLSGAKVMPKKLLERGFSFAYPHIKEALRKALVPSIL